MSVLITPELPLLEHVQSCEIITTPDSTDPSVENLSFQLLLSIRPEYELVPFPSPENGSALLNNIYLNTQLKAVPGTEIQTFPIYLGIGPLMAEYNFNVYFCEFDNYSTQTNARPPKNKVINYKPSPSHMPQAPHPHVFKPNLVKDKFTNIKNNKTANNTSSGKLKRK